MSTKKCICAADLSQPIVIETPTDEPDGMGGKLDGWDQVMDAWALVEPGKGKERFVAGRLQSEVFHTVTIRFPFDVEIVSGMRVRFRNPYNRDVIYNIRAVVDVMLKHEFLEITCEEGVGT